MPIRELNPNSTEQQGDWSINDTTVHGALSSGTDVAYVESTGFADEFVVTGLAPPELPSNTGVLAARITLRHSQSDDIRVHYDIGFFDVAQNGIGTAYAKNIDSSTVEADVTAWEPNDPHGEPWAIDLFESDYGVWALHNGIAAAEVRLHEVVVEVDYREPPTATYDAPTGTVTDTSTPTVEWTYDAVDSDDDPQGGYEVRVYHGDDEPGGGWPSDPGDITASPVYEATASSSDGSHTVAEPLPESDVTYQAYVRVRKQWTGPSDLWSDWDSGSFTLDLDTASAPGVTLTAEPSDARIRIDLADDGTGAGGSADWFTVEYRDSSEDAWQWVRDGRQVDADASGEATLYDHEAPLNATREYRARSVIGNGTEIVGPATTDTSPTLDTGNTRWLKDPHDPTRDTVIRAQSYSHSRRGRQEVHRPVGMSAAVVEAEEPGGLDGSYSIVTRTTSEYDAVRDLVDSPGTLLLQDRRHSRYVRVTGDRSFDQQGPDDTGIDLINITVVETTRPSVD